ncbi:hypothetical protein V2W45_1499523 [Cenococcum geophilum]
MDQGNKNRAKKLPSDVSGDGANISSPNFVFVTTTDPTKESDRSTRRRIHQHAMSRIGRSRRTRPRLVQFTYNVRSSGDPGITIQQPALPQRPDTYGYNTQDIGVGNPNTESTSQEIRPANATPGPVTPLGAGPGVDPFNTNDRENRQSIAHYSASLRQLNEALASPDPAVSTSVDVVRAVLAFICHDYISGDLERWRFHVEGLERIIKLRGGVDTLNSDRAVRLMVFWIDMTGSLVTDSALLFPIPQAFVPSLRSLPTKEPSPTLSRLATRWHINCFASSDIMDVFLDLHRLTTLLTSYSTTPHGDIWQDELFVGLVANPITHALLSLPRFVEADERAFALREACRVGAMMFVACLRQQFDCYPDAVRPHKWTLQQLLQQSSGDDWGELYDLWIWLRVLEGLVVDEGEEMEEVAASLRNAMWKAALSWEEVMRTARAVLWIDRIFDVRAENLKRKVVTTLDFIVHEGHQRALLSIGSPCTDE